MPIDALMRVPCTILRFSEGTADRYGDATVGTTEALAVCAYEQVPPPPTRGGETDGGQVATSNWRFYFPAAVGSFVGADAVTVDDATYQFSGDPWPVLRPGGVVHHYEALARRVA